MKQFIFFSCFLICQIHFAQQIKFFKIKKYEVAALSDSLRENSGLSFYKNHLYTFNDGGNSSELFLIDAKTGNILNKITTHFQNKDWEALTNDGEDFYIGDIGNNAGTRRDLTIYKLPVESVVRASSSNNAHHAPKTISFYYPEQKDFTPKNLKHNFDAEAMVFYKDKIHLFTKEWASKSTTHYTIDPQISENQPALKVETYKTGFVVTDAALHHGKLYLIGYTKKTEIFLEIFEISDQELFFTLPSVKYYLGSSVSLGQLEGIAVNDTGIYLAGERFQVPLASTLPKFYYIPFLELK